jgi:hypothetical protein
MRKVNAAFLARDVLLLAIDAAAFRPDRGLPISTSAVSHAICSRVLILPAS